MRRAGSTCSAWKPSPRLNGRTASSSPEGTAWFPSNLSSARAGPFLPSARAAAAESTSAVRTAKARRAGTPSPPDVFEVHGAVELGGQRLHEGVAEERPDRPPKVHLRVV